MDPENLELMDFFGFLNGLFMDFAAKGSGFWCCLNRVSTRILDFGQQALSRKDTDLDWEGAELLQGLVSLLKWHTSGIQLTVTFLTKFLDAVSQRRN